MTSAGPYVPWGPLLEKKITLSHPLETALAQSLLPSFFPSVHACAPLPLSLDVLQSRRPLVRSAYFSVALSNSPRLATRLQTHDRDLEVFLEKEASEPVEERGEEVGHSCSGRAGENLGGRSRGLDARALA